MRFNKKENIQLAKELLSLLKSKKKIIAKKIIQDVKKPLKDADLEVQNSINILNFAIKEFLKIKFSLDISKNKKTIGKIMYEPIGCVALITPWNYPLLTIFERLPFALLSGCNIILKPSEYTPNFNAFLKKILKKNRIINNKIKIILSKDKSKGISLSYDKNIDMISFVGSSNTAKKIMRQASNSLKKIHLELGGKNTAILLDEKFDNKILDQIIFGIFENSGRACVAISRVLINEKIFDVFFNSLKYRILNKFIKNNIFKRKVLKFEKRKIESVINSLDKKINNKNKIYLSKNIENFCLLINDKNSKHEKLLDEEFFFPIISCQSFKDKNQLIEKANKSKYGLACYIFSKNKNKIQNTIKYLDFGRIWINSGPKNWDPKFPVGGKKMSGKSFDMGSYGFFNYLLPKSIYHKRIL